MSFRRRRNLREKLRKESRQSLWSLLWRFLLRRNDKTIVKVNLTGSLYFGIWTQALANSEAIQKKKLEFQTPSDYSVLLFP